MDGCVIRKAGVHDADRLGECMDAAYARYAGRIVDLPLMSAECAEEIARHGVWVAEIGDAVVGGLVLVPSEGFMLLANVAVHPDNRGQGIGQRLLLLAEAETRRRGYSEMHLNTHAHMPETIRLHSRNGWVEAGRQANTVKMKKVLPQ